MGAEGNIKSHLMEAEQTENLSFSLSFHCYCYIMYALDILIDFNLLIKLNLREVKPNCNWILDFWTGRPQVVRVGEAGVCRAHSEHWSAAGLLSRPLTLYPVHTRLCLHPGQHHHPGPR